MEWGPPLHRHFSLVPSIVPLAALLAIVGGCADTPPPPTVMDTTEATIASSEPPVVAFTDATEGSGLDFVHFNGMTGNFYIPETMGPGAAFIDYDGDGDLDVYVLQGSMLDDAPLSSAMAPHRHPGPPRDRLYRNDTAPGDGIPSPSLRFTDVTEAAGLSPHGYGMGIASGDFDNDGHIDLYVTRWGANQLLRNLGNGRFADVTEASGSQDPRWSISASFLDFDRDGWLDLFIANYVDFRLSNHRTCFADNGSRDYCGPLAFDPQPDRLLRNRGDGTFEDVSAASGIRRAFGNGLGVVAADFNGDRWLDLYVANDEMANQLWINRRDGSFEDTALLAGCALSGEGLAESSMGVDAADVDGDGDEDLFLSHLRQQTNTLYLNDGSANFHDATAFSRLGEGSWASTGFGTAFVDYDNDGWLDLFVANGAVKTLESLAAAGDPFPLSQPNQLFRNLGHGRFEEVSAAQPAMAELAVSRGAAFGDLDNDGDTDILVLNNNGPLQLLRNDVGQDAAWVGLRLIGPSGRDQLGAQVEIRADGEPRSLHRRLHTGGSYASANDSRLLVGLGDASEPVEVIVTWPDGQSQRWSGIPTGRYTTLRQGDDSPVEPAAARQR